MLHSIPLGIIAPAPDPVAISYIGNAVDASNQSSAYTFSSQSIGTAAADRYVVVCASTVNEDITSVTIGGVTASLVKKQTNSTSCVGMWQLLVPAGTTATVVVNLGGTGEVRCGIAIWTRTGGASASATDTAGATTNGGSLAVDVNANGGVIGYSQMIGPATITWTNLTKKFEAIMEATTYQTGANDDFATAQTVSVTAQTSGSPSLVTGVSAAFG